MQGFRGFGDEGSGGSGGSGDALLNALNSPPVRRAAGTARLPPTHRAVDLMDARISSFGKDASMRSTALPAERARQRRDHGHHRGDARDAEVCGRRDPISDILFLKIWNLGTLFFMVLNACEAAGVGTACGYSPRPSPCLSPRAGRGAAQRRSSPLPVYGERQGEGPGE